MILLLSLLIYVLGLTPILRDVGVLPFPIEAILIFIPITFARRIDWLFICFFLYLLLRDSTADCDNMYIDRYSYLINFLKYVFIVRYISLLDKRDYKLVRLVFVLGVMAIAVFSLIFGGYIYGRLIPVFDIHMNMFSISCLVVIVLLFERSVLSQLVKTLGLSVIVLVGSRLALFMVLSTYIRKFSQIILLVIIGGVFVSMANFRVFDFSSGIGRLSQLLANLRVIQDSPLFGVGSLCSAYDLSLGVVRSNVGWTEFLASYGIIGMVMAFAVFRKYTRDLDKKFVVLTLLGLLGYNFMVLIPLALLARKS